MYSVELYMRVRRACMVDGMSVPGGVPRVRPAQRHRPQDAQVRRSARLWGLWGPPQNLSATSGVTTKWDTSMLKLPFKT